MKYRVSFSIFICLVLLCGCSSVFEPVSNSTHDSRLYNKSDGCALSIQTSAFLPPISSGRFETPNQILAGFQTSWIPGAAPIACDQLDLIIGSGAFTFRVRDELIERGESSAGLSRAVLEIVSFTPLDDGIRIVPAEQWDEPGGSFGVGVIGSAPGSTIRDYSVFKLKSAVRGSNGWGTSPPYSQTLSVGDGRFSVSNSRGQANIDVTEEVLRYLREDRRDLDFIIVPDDLGMGMKSSSRAIGRFEVQLNLFFDD
ncbi:MAG: hypothetical protein V7782_00400 [Psychromonas sp.]